MKRYEKELKANLQNVDKIAELTVNRDHNNSGYSVVILT